MAQKIRTETCANCNHEFIEKENFCPVCGQENHTPNQPIKHYATELIESLLHLDSKFFHTVWSMLRYPGKITLEYNNNKRARYTPPVRLYIFVSLVFFLLIQIPEKVSPEINADEQILKKQIRDSIATIQTKINDSLKTNVRLDSQYYYDLGILNIKIGKDELPLYKEAGPERIDSIIVVNGYKPNYFTRTIYKQIIKLTSQNESFVTHFKEKVIKYTSMGLFLLMPVFAFIVYLLYYRRKKNYYDFLIFSIHYHTLIFIIYSVILILAIFFELSIWIYLFTILALLLYLAKALRYNYQGSRSKTVLKLFILSGVYGIAIFICFVVVAALGFWFV